jgi:hypothetical protein
VNDREIIYRGVMGTGFGIIIVKNGKKIPMS